MPPPSVLRITRPHVLFLLFSETGGKYQLLIGRAVLPAIDKSSKVW